MLLVVRHASFFSSFLKRSHRFYFIFFISCLCIDSLNLFVRSVFHSAGGLSRLSYLCGWLTGSHRVHLPPRGLGLGSWCFVTTLAERSDTFCSVCCRGQLSLICFWKLHYPFFFHAAGTTTTFAWIPKLIIKHFFPLANCIFFCLFDVWLHGTGILHLFNNVALLSSSLYCKSIWKATAWLWPDEVLDRTGPNCGREMWAEECAERDSVMLS